jgi:hypothetical protein
MAEPELLARRSVGSTQARKVQIDYPCLDCNEPIRVRMRDGVILEASPPSIVGHVNVPFSRWMENPAFA